MEWLNLVALIAITFSNLYIGIHVRNQQISKEEKFEDVRIAALHFEAALKNALQELPQPKAPVVTVLAEPFDVRFEFDYNKLSAAIKTAIIEAQIAVHNATDGAQQPIHIQVYSEPQTNAVPFPYEISNSNTVEIDGIPARQFPVQ